VTAAPTTHAAVHLRDLGRRYGRQTVLRGINLEVVPGRVVLLRGSNGAGKTTLLQVLSTRLRPSRGGGSVFGHDLVRAAPEVRRKVAYLSVFGGSYPMLSAAENLALAARLYGRDVDLDELLEQVGLTAAGDKLVRTFSSGMKKRLALARLLLAEARLWLLDEPYAALDDEGKGLVDRLLVGARSQGRTVLVASHEVARCAPFVDAQLALDGGRLQVWGGDV
jgi:heme ABC exporter ATP-binding subunit CcmA